MGLSRAVGGRVLGHNRSCSRTGSPVPDVPTKQLPTATWSSKKSRSRTKSQAGLRSNDNPCAVARLRYGKIKPQGTETNNDRFQGLALAALVVGYILLAG